MANYYESSRSNYVKVKDLEEFKKFAALFGATVEPRDKWENSDEYCLLWEDGFQDIPYNSETGDEMDGDFIKDVAGHLQENSVLVVMGSGHEKLRYVTGWAFAVDCTGESVAVNIDSIYALAGDKFKGKEVTSAEY